MQYNINQEQFNIIMNNMQKMHKTMAEMTESYLEIMQILQNAKFNIQSGLDTILVTPENYDTLNQRTYKGVKCWKNKDYNRAAQARDAIIAEPIWQTVFAKENDFYGIESMTVSEYKTKTIKKKIGGKEYETNIAIESFKTGNNDVNLLSRIRMTDKKTKTLVPLADDAAWAFLVAFGTVADASENAAYTGANCARRYAGDRLGALLVLESALCR